MNALDGSKAAVSDFIPRGKASKTQQVRIAGFQAKKALPLEEPVKRFVCGSQPEKKETDPEEDKKKR